MCADFEARSLDKGVFDVSLRILFADDSMTAQNMGKKILTEAGYEVVAVSNGAAAVKKIAEQKPDIIILDVYMPGYSGLEVCEKVRGSLETLKTPVLLTVGKMEPYKPEDANRVKADGVIIKPFEASDLLAIIKKFEERIGQIPAPPPMVEQTVRLERQYQEDAITEAHMQNHATGKTGMQPMVEVPDHMAGSSAFPDMLGSDSAVAPQHFAVNTPATAFETSVIVPAPPVPSTEYSVPVAWKEESTPEHESVAAPAMDDPQEIVATPVGSSPAPDTVAIPVESSPEPEPVSAEEVEANAMPVEAIEEPAHPHFIPVFKEPEAEHASYEMLPTAAAPTGDLEIPREPALEDRAEETTRATVVDRVEPGLMSSLEQQTETHVTAPEEGSHASWPSAASTAGAAYQPIASTETEAAAAENYSAPLPADNLPTDTLPKINATSEVSDADFEARVAAAMAAYSHVTEATVPQVSASTVSDAARPEAASSAYAAQAVAVPEPEAEAAPSFEYHPPIRVPDAVSTVPSGPAQVAAEPVLAIPVSEPAAPEPAGVHQVVSASVEAAAVAAGAETGTEHENIAQAVHRVMERLKPELVEEIMRELRLKK
jgi:CheY-like chemotaxis protein